MDVDVFRSARFWMTVALFAALTIMACLRVITGDVAVGTMAGVVGGYGVGRTKVGS